MYVKPSNRYIILNIVGIYLNIFEQFIILFFENIFLEISPEHINNEMYNNIILYKCYQKRHIHI